MCFSLSPSSTSGTKTLRAARPPRCLCPFAAALPFSLYPLYRASTSNVQYSDSPSHLRRLERNHRSVSASRSYLPTHRFRYLRLPTRHAKARERHAVVL